MNIPDLPPDLVFRRLSDDQESLRFSYEVKRAALGPHVSAKWNWDESFQLRVHENYFRQRPFFAVNFAGAKAGTISLMEQDGAIHLNEFYLLPRYQRQGLGSRILSHCLGLADIMSLPVRLQYLKWNPVGRLYYRHGFSQSGETDIHYLLERPIPVSQI